MWSLRISQRPRYSINDIRFHPIAKDMFHDIEEE
jgi:hypothetical protein